MYQISLKDSTEIKNAIKLIDSLKWHSFNYNIDGNKLSVKSFDDFQLIKDLLKTHNITYIEKRSYINLDPTDLIDFKEFVIKLFRNHPNVYEIQYYYTWPELRDWLSKQNKKVGELIKKFNSLKMKKKSDKDYEKFKNWYDETTQKAFGDKSPYDWSIKSEWQPYKIELFKEAYEEYPEYKKGYWVFNIWFDNGDQTMKFFCAVDPDGDIFEFVPDYQVSDEVVVEMKTKVQQMIEDGEIEKKGNMMWIKKGMKKQSQSELNQGKQIEKEHKDVFKNIKEDVEEDDYLDMTEDDFTEGIAKDHLEEDKNYYTKLTDMEKKSKLQVEDQVENRLVMGEYGTIEDIDEERDRALVRYWKWVPEADEDQIFREWWDFKDIRLISSAENNLEKQSSMKKKSEISWSSGFKAKLKRPIGTFREFWNQGEIVTIKEKSGEGSLWCIDSKGNDMGWVYPSDLDWVQQSSLERKLETFNWFDIKKGDTIKYIKPGTTDILLTGVVIGKESTNTDDFVIVERNGEPKYISIQNVGNLYKKKQSSIKQDIENINKQTNQIKQIREEMEDDFDQWHKEDGFYDDEDYDDIYKPIRKEEIGDNEQYSDLYGDKVMDILRKKKQNKNMEKKQTLKIIETNDPDLDKYAVKDSNGNIVDSGNNLKELQSKYNKTKIATVEDIVEFEDESVDGNPELDDYIKPAIDIKQSPRVIIQQLLGLLYSQRPDSLTYTSIVEVAEQAGLMDLERYDLISILNEVAVKVGLVRIGWDEYLPEKDIVQEIQDLPSNFESHPTFDEKDFDVNEVMNGYDITSEKLFTLDRILDERLKMFTNVDDVLSQSVEVISKVMRPFQKHLSIVSYKLEDVKVKKTSRDGKIVEGKIIYNVRLRNPKKGNTQGRYLEKTITIEIPILGQKAINPIKFHYSKKDWPFQPYFINDIMGVV